ncbi:spore cortex biosynthesis protein YabQ [Paenibacillus sp. 1781tsa1]|uniref:spore cortex biosynthesis protein YabQ n=1 Tax=unclassified Paenibacillus TaxID=185978 RepID=UPI0020A14E27|nr:spore cortex biosynthesis protein YabQ [Paenibacillus sp. 1781tsa1]MCP1181497.1 spore cortex biosynthesis protein YabQ [Paenibacillus sp. 1781tsa1]
MSPDTQWITLMWMLTSGVVMGMAYDSYRVLSGQLRFPRWSIHTLDLLYWVASALFVFRMLYAGNHGQLRFYVFLGLIIGVCFYFWLLSVTTQRFVVMLIKLARTLIHWCGHILNILIVMPVKGIYKFIRVLFGFVIAILLFLGRLVLQFLVPFGKLFRWMFRPLLKYWVTPRFMIRVGTRIAAIWKRWF